MKPGHQGENDKVDDDNIVSIADDWQVPYNVDVSVNHFILRPTDDGLSSLQKLWAGCSQEASAIERIF